MDSRHDSPTATAAVVGRSGRRRSLLVALVSSLWLTLGVGAAEAGHEPSPSVMRGLFNQGLLPTSTGLDAPPGDYRATSFSADAGVSAAAGGAPLRVYVVVVDGLLPQQIGLRTPMLNELKTQGTWWNQARAVLPTETLPNHAAMATGVRPARNGIIANQFYRGHDVKEYMQYPQFWEADTITTRLERAYEGEIDTATILSKEYLFGLFRGEHPGPADPRPQREADFHWDPRTQAGYVSSPSDHALDAATMDAFLGWIDAEAGSPRPQFAFVNLGDVDRAGHADEEGAAIAAADRAASGNDELSETYSTPFQQGAIEETDAQIRRLVDKLTAVGAWDESVLIFLSDHGMDWGAQHQVNEAEQDLTAKGYTRTQNGGRTGEFFTVGGGGSELIYVYNERHIEEMARTVCEAAGVAVVATRQPVSDLNGSTCKGRTLGELGIDHRYSPDIEIFLEPGWRSSPGYPDPQGNPLPGNHGHGVTQHSALFVTGGHPALKPSEAADSGAPAFYEPGNVAPPAGPGVMSVAPTVAGLFGIGSPAGGYEAAPLAAAFDPGVVALNGEDPIVAPSSGGGEDEEPAAAAGGTPLLTVGSDVTTADLTKATYEVFVANRGNAAANDVIVTNPVPANTAFASSSRPPLDSAACATGAPAGTSCRWTVGDLAPGESSRFEVTYDLAQTATSYIVNNAVSAQLEGAAPAASDVANTDNSLSRDVFSGLGGTTSLEDAHVNGGAAPNQNYGKCAAIEVGAANASTAFLDADSAFPNESGGSADLQRVGTLWAAELQATTADSPSGEVGVAAHRISSREWTEGAGTCPAGAAGTARDARTPGPADARPASDPSPLDTDSAGEAGDVLRWDVEDALDTRRERRDSNGFELRLADVGGAPPADSTVRFHSREATDATVRPRFVTVRSKIRLPTCIDADPETATRASDEKQRFRAYATDGAEITNAAGEKACNGSPFAGAPIGWEFDDDAPDAYISSLAGEPTQPEGVGSGNAAPNRGSTVTGPNGRTFIDLRLAEPYEQSDNSGGHKVAAIVLNEHLNAGSSKPPFGESSEGVCEDGDLGQGGGPPAGGCASESAVEDDVSTTWEPAVPPVLSIGGDINVGEGHSGQTNVDFTLSLSRASELPVSVTYRTVDAGATAPSDYDARGPARLTFAPGETEKTLSVPVWGDELTEPDEKFTLELSEAANAELTSTSATATIVNDDDSSPLLSISDAALGEDEAAAGAATFAITLSRAAENAVGVTYETSDGTANAPGDYEAHAPTRVIFEPGETEKLVSVRISDDPLDEPKETFMVGLSAPQNAEILRPAGTGTIFDDDGLSDADGDTVADAFDTSPGTEGSPPRTGLSGSSPPTTDTRPGRCEGLEATITGTGISDSGVLLGGTSRRDVIAALGGNDRAYGRGGADFVCGGTGSDVLRGGRGDDRVRGGQGPDAIFGDGGNDTLTGGRGNDRIFATGGSRDRVNCGRGRDVVHAGLADEVAASCEKVRRSSRGSSD